MDEVWQRVSEELELRKKNWAWLSREIGFSEQRVNNWSRRAVPPSSYAAVAAALDWTIDRLLGREEDGETSGPIPLDGNDDYPAIQRVKFKVSAGTSGFQVSYLGDQGGAPIVFRAGWYRERGFDPASLFAIEVIGASMEPGLGAGDTVVVNTASTEAKDGFVFAANYEGELVVKRLIRDEGAWWLASDNPDQRRYPRKRADENTFLLGEVVHKQSERI